AAWLRGGIYSRLRRRARPPPGLDLVDAPRARRLGPSSPLQQNSPPARASARIRARHSHLQCGKWASTRTPPQPALSGLASPPARPRQGRIFVMSSLWSRFNEEVVACRRCPRLVAHREQVAREKRRAYRDCEYWGKPVPGFGDPEARVLILGLAPGAHGSNRTGRPFTGDSSGNFMYPVLHRTGFAS